MGGRHLRLRSINHVSKVCSNLEASVEFYRDFLGFIEIKRPDSFDFEGCWLWRYGLGLHLIQGSPVPRSKHIDPKSDHLSFQADSLENVERHLKQRGIPYVRQRVLEGGVEVQQLFFHDPDNNMIEVCNCDCLPIIPLDLGRCQTCTDEALRLTGACQACAPPCSGASPAPLHPHCHGCCRPERLAEEEEESGGSMDCEDSTRGSIDSLRSEQFAAAASIQAMALAPGSPLRHAFAT